MKKKENKTDGRIRNLTNKNKNRMIEYKTSRGTKIAKFRGTRENGKIMISYDKDSDYATPMAANEAILNKDFKFV